MNKIIKINLSVILIIAVMLTSNISVSASSGHLTEKQQDYADRIAEYAIEHWDTYHVLPSLAVAQAMEESTLGEHCAYYNLWGIASGAEHYSSLEEGVDRYLRVINNGYYDKALNNWNFYDAISEIIEGGYCVGNPNYVSDCSYIYYRYNLGKYDNKLKTYLKKQKEKRKQKKIEKRHEKTANKTWLVCYDETLKPNQLAIPKKFIKVGTANLYTEDGLELLGIYDVTPADLPDNKSIHVVYTSNKDLVGTYVKIDSHEEAKG